MRSPLISGTEGWCVRKRAWAAGDPFVSQASFAGVRHGLVRHYSHALVRPTRPHSTQRGLSTIAAALVIGLSLGVRRHADSVDRAVVGDGAEVGVKFPSLTAT